MSAVVTLARLVDRGLVTENFGLSGLTTYRFGGPARYFSEVNSEAELIEIASVSGDLPMLVVGRGSNLVIADAGFDGMVLHLGPGFGEMEFDHDVTAGGAVSLPVLARRCAKEGRGGLEWCVGVPGSVGGAVRMNAGCHGSEIADSLITARVVDLRAGSGADLTTEDLQLSYRHSRLFSHEVVVGARFRVVETDPASSEAEIRRITAWRKENQPGGTLNAGSVFKNPSGDAAGRIIDSLGLKGFAIGSAAVSDRHANFFVAGEEATAQDVYELVWAVRRKVGEATGIWLEPEVRFEGEFAPAPDAQAGP